MTLVELIVTVMVSALLLGLIASIFGQGLKTQQQQASRTNASMQLSAVSTMLTESLRSSVTTRLPEGTSRLDLQVINASGDAFECRSWVVADQKLWYREGPGNVGGWSTEWAVLAESLLEPAAGSEQSGFSRGAGESVLYSFTAGSGDVAVTIKDGGYPRVKTTMEGNPCWS